MEESSHSEVSNIKMKMEIDPDINEEICNSDKEHLIESEDSKLRIEISKIGHSPIYDPKSKSDNTKSKSPFQRSFSLKEISYSARKRRFDYMELPAFKFQRSLSFLDHQKMTLKRKLANNEFQPTKSNKFEYKEPLSTFKRPVNKKESLKFDRASSKDKYKLKRSFSHYHRKSNNEEPSKSHFKRSMSNKERSISKIKKKHSAKKRAAYERLNNSSSSSNFENTLSGSKVASETRVDDIEMQEIVKYKPRNIIPNKLEESSTLLHELHIDKGNYTENTSVNTELSDISQSINSQNTSTVPRCMHTQPTSVIQSQEPIDTNRRQCELTERSEQIQPDNHVSISNPSDFNETLGNSQPLDDASARTKSSIKKIANRICSGVSSFCYSLLPSFIVILVKRFDFGFSSLRNSDFFSKLIQFALALASIITFSYYEVPTTMKEDAFDMIDAISNTSLSNNLTDILCILPTNKNLMISGSLSMTVVGTGILIVTFLVDGMNRSNSKQIIFLDITIVILSIITSIMVFDYKSESKRLLSIADNTYIPLYYVRQVFFSFIGLTLISLFSMCWKIWFTYKDCLNVGKLSASDILI